MKSAAEEPKQTQSAMKFVASTAKEYLSLRGPLVSAAITFYVLLAATPTLVLGIAFAGVAMGDESAREQLLGWSTDFLGSAAGSAVEDFLLSVDYLEGGWVAAFGGFLVLAFSATRLFAATQHGLNQVWGVRLRTDRSFKKAAKGLLRKRVLSFLLVFTVGLVLTLGLAARAVWLSFFSSEDAAWGMAMAQVLTELVVTSVLMGAVFIVVFRFLPDARVEWRDAVIGGLGTAVLFSVGASLAGLYLQHVSPSSALGAAGTLGVVLLWINYCANAFFVGATFTHAWAERRGRGAQPEPHAVRVKTSVKKRVRGEDDGSHTRKPTRRTE